MHNRYNKYYSHVYLKICSYEFVNKPVSNISDNISMRNIKNINIKY